MKPIKVSHINKDQTFIFKAIGIILIAFHNFYRWVTPITGENEFYHSSNYIKNSYLAIANQPLEIFNVFFNYIGHFGVQVFIFLSAYGLTKSYFSKDLKWGFFVKKRFLKLYPTLLLSTFLLFLFGMVAHGNLPGIKTLREIGIQLTLFSTFVPGKGLAAVGPWWFYSMIFQFYLIFPLIIKLINKYGDKVLLIISIIGYLLLIFLNPELSKVKLNLIQMVFGHLPEFCFGIWAARQKEIKISWLIIVGALIIFVLSNWFKPFWYFSHLSASILLIPLVSVLSKTISKYSTTKSIFKFIGTISVYIFAIHGFIRWDMVGLANFFSNPLAALLVAIAFFTISSGLAWMLFTTENQMRTWIKSGDTKRIRIMRTVLLILLPALLSFGAKSCESYKYYQDKKKKEQKITAVKMDFEQKISGNYLIIDSTKHSGKKSLLIDKEHPYSPEFKFDLRANNSTSIKEIRVNFACKLSDNIQIPKVHAVMECRNKEDKKLLNWESKKLIDTVNYTNWQKTELIFNLHPSFFQKNCALKFYIWNNSEEPVFIDDYEVEFIYLK